MECIIAKIFGSESLKEAAIELFMKTHGGRSFLKGHLLGDNIHDYLAPCIYEGEGEMLGLAFFKSLIKEHGKAYFEPIGKALQRNNLKSFSPSNPAHLWALRTELGQYSRWVLSQKVRSIGAQPPAGMDARLAGHLQFAVRGLQRAPLEISGVMRKHQLKLADRQCRMAELSQRTQNLVIMLVTALWAHRQKDPIAQGAADILCQDLRRSFTGERPSDQYLRAAGKLADQIIAGGFEVLAGAPRVEIMMKYENS
jgi:hypothetical protein